MSKRYDIRQASQKDSAALLQLINETPQEGSVQLNFERQPNFFHGTQVTTSDPEVWLMEDKEKNKVIASFSIGKRYVYLNGEKRFTRYGNDLRIHNDYKGGRTLFRLFKKYKELMQDEWMQTVILDENKASIETVGSGRLTLPTYHPAGQFITHMVALNKSYPKPKQAIRRATEQDIELIQDFFDQHSKDKAFYPCYDFKQISSNSPYYRNLNIRDYFLYFSGDELQGVVGTWNQKSFKQTRFLAYQGGMKLLRHVNNISSKLFGGLSLPNPGELGNYISLHSILCLGNEADILKELLLAVCNEFKQSNFDALIIGFDKRDPLHRALKGFKSHTLTSNHYLASYGDKPEFLQGLEGVGQQPLIYLEPSRL